MVRWVVIFLCKNIIKFSQFIELVLYYSKHFFGPHMTIWASDECTWSICVTHSVHFCMIWFDERHLMNVCYTMAKCEMHECKLLDAFQCRMSVLSWAPCEHLIPDQSNDTLSLENRWKSRFKRGKNPRNFHVSHSVVLYICIIMNSVGKPQCIAARARIYFTEKM